MSIRSVHFRRTVTTQRSANAFARGACGGVLKVAMPAPVNTVVEGGGELGVAVAQRESQRVCSLVEVDQQVACLLGDAGAVGWAVTPTTWTWREAVSRKNST
jgi:hypothetical protein